MPRTAPVMPTEAPGNFITGALFNATVKATGDWQVGVPRFKGFAASAQAIGSSTTFASLTLDGEYIDSDGGHSTTTNTSRYVCQVAGWYWVQGTCSVPAGGGAGNRALQIGLNGGGTIQGSTSVMAASGANSWAGQTATFVQMGVGDYVEVQFWQNSGGSLNTTVSGGLQPTLTAIWISS